MASARSTISSMIPASSKSFGVKIAATPAAVSTGRSSAGMIPPSTTGASTPSAASRAEHVGHELEVGSGEDRQADHVGVLVACRGGDLLGGQADPGVDDFHPGVASGDGDLFGAVGVPVEAGLGDEQVGAGRRHGLHPLRHRGEPTAGPRHLADPGRARYSPKTSRISRPIPRSSRRRGRGRSSPASRWRWSRRPGAGRPRPRSRPRRHARPAIVRRRRSARPRPPSRRAGSRPRRRAVTVRSR